MIEENSLTKTDAASGISESVRLFFCYIGEFGALSDVTKKPSGQDTQGLAQRSEVTRTKM